jgi:hypothetical protein
VALHHRILLALALLALPACTSADDGGTAPDATEDTSTGDATTEDTSGPRDTGSRDADASSDIADGDTATDTTPSTDVVDADAAEDALTVAPVDIDLVETKKDLDAATLTPATFSARVVITGGVPPFTVTVAPGALPPGLALVGNPGPAPRIEGAWDASTAGADAATFGLTAADSSGLVSPVRSFSVALPPLADVVPVGGTATSLRDAVIDAVYTEKLVVTSTIGPLSFVSTTMPSPVGGGITFDTVGFSFSGTPTTLLPKTSYDFTFRDAAKRTIDKTFDLTIKNSIPLALSPSTPTLSSGDVSIPDVVFGSPYAQTFIVAPTGNPPYSAVVTGTPFTGLSAVIKDPGTATTEVTLSGTPTAAAEIGTTKKITITVTDALSATTSYTYAVRLLARPPSITAASLVAARAGVAYTKTFSATGGTSPLTWSPTAGFTGTGLTQSTSGTLSGTPAASTGDTDLTLSIALSDATTDRVTGAAAPRTATATLTLHVNPGYRVNIWPLFNNPEGAGGYGCTGCHFPASATETYKPSFQGTPFGTAAGTENASGLISIAAGGTTGLATASKCGGAGRVYVSPGAPSSSLVFLKITGTSSSPPPCGTCMPFTGSCNATPTMSLADRTMIQNWIKSVASSADNK